MQEISGFRTGVIGYALVETTYSRVVSYAIRRREFDAFLLRRAGAQVLEETPVKTLRRSGGRWVVNDTIETAVVIGAGGHFCPVAKHLRGGADTSSPVVAKEIEFKLDPEHAHRIPATPELFFCRDMEGYAWSVRKGDYLNVGIGRRDSKAFARHIEEFVAFLERRQTLEPGSRPRWHGHAYMAWGAGARPILADGMLVVGDAAGLAFPESGEGIKPAIESGRLAADALIASGGRTDVGALRPYAEAILPPLSLDEAQPCSSPRRPGHAWAGSPAFANLHQTRGAGSLVPTDRVGIVNGTHDPRSTDQVSASSVRSYRARMAPTISTTVSTSRPAR